MKVNSGEEIYCIFKCNLSVGGQFLAGSQISSQPMSNGKIASSINDL
jgi:hypothetical protein